MKVVIVLFGSRGDVVPSAALAEALLRSGHEVRMMVPEEYLGLVPQGCEPSKYPVSFADSQAGIIQALANDEKLTPDRIFALESGERFSPERFERTSAAVWTLANGWADIIVCDGNTSWVCFTIAEMLNLNLAIMLVADVLPRFDKFGLATSDPPPPFLTFYIHYLVQTHFVCPAPMCATINAYRAQQGLAPMLTPWTMIFDLRPNYLAHYSPTLFPPAREWRTWGWDESICVCGDLQTQLSGLVEPADPALVRFLAEGDAPVYMGWGSLPLGQVVSEVALRSLKRVGRRGVLLCGTHPHSQLRLGVQQLDSSAEDHAELVAWCAANVLFIDACSHSWLFPRCCAVVHHGGAGTTIAGFKLGVPTIITPTAYDQFEHMRTAVAQGVQPEPMPPVQLLTVKKLAGALEAMLTDPRYKQRAEALAARLAAEEPAGSVACRALERFAQRRPSLWDEYRAQQAAATPTKAPYLWWWPLADLLLNPNLKFAAVRYATAAAGLAAVAAGVLRVSRK